MTDLQTTKRTRITAADIQEAMARKWAAPEYALMWEVGDATGGRVRRYADAVIMSLWPSRGLELHGVEIKISRADWKREAADPLKAEAIARYCDRWWVHTSPGVVDDLSSLPPAWGLREFDGKNWKTLREAEKTASEPISRPFLAALLRRSDGAIRILAEKATAEAREQMRAEAEFLRGNYHKDITRAVEQRTAALADAQKNVDAFTAAFGATPIEFGVNYSYLGAAARALAACNQGNMWPPLSQRLRRAADEIDAISKLSEPQP